MIDGIRTIHDERRMFNAMKKIKQFLGEVRHEMKETTWPKAKDLRKNSITVFGVMAFFGVFFYAADSLITFLINLV